MTPSLPETSWQWMIPIALVVMAIFFLNAGGGEAGLRQWAVKQELDLISIERRRWLKGPFFLHCGKNDRVYFFLARNSLGQQRCGFARVRPPLLSFLSKPVTVAWEDVEWN